MLRDVDNGAGGNTTTFYYSFDAPTTDPQSVTWTQLGAAVVNAGTTSIFVSTANLQVGAHNNGGAGTIFNGQILSAYVYNGIGGTLAASFNASDTYAGVISFASVLTGEVYTVNGSASIQGNYDRRYLGSDDPKAILRWSDDGGFTWSNDHYASLGKTGQYKNRAIWRRLGQARDRIFEVEVTDPVIRNVISANLNASAGAH